mgnify:CR=1 FL=1
MNGATTDPWVAIISHPNSAKNNIMGNNHHFFLILKKSQSSLKKSINEKLIRVIFSFFLSNYNK